jgi:hypothetical protein
MAADLRAISNKKRDGATKRSDKRAKQRAKIRLVDVTAHQIRRTSCVLQPFSASHRALKATKRQSVKTAHVIERARILKRHCGAPLSDKWKHIYQTRESAISNTRN